MAGNRCVFYNCGNSCIKDRSLRMYRFPVKDTERCKKWILNSGNGTLADLSPNILRKKLLCSKHFTAKQIVPQRLPLDAIPERYVSESSWSKDLLIENMKVEVDDIELQEPHTEFMQASSHSSMQMDDVDTGSSDYLQNDNLGDCELFGKYVAEELRALPFLERITLQQGIMRCFTKVI